MIEPNHSYTIEEYWKLVDTFPDRKYEYIDGHIRMMSRGSPAHAEIGGRIFSLLETHLDKIESECHVYNSDITLLLSNQRIYHPDAAVSCDPHGWTRKDGLEAPTVVVEVLSPTTEQTDRSEKLLVYQRYPTIQEILFIDSRKRLVEHHHRIGVSAWQHVIYEHDEDIIDLSSIEVQITVGDIYRRVYLEEEEARLQGNG